MANAELTRYRMPEDEHKVLRIRLMRLIDREELYRARGRRGLYRIVTGRQVERCSAVTDEHVQVLIAIGFVGEETRAVTRYLKPGNTEPVRLNPLFLGTNARAYLGTHSHVW